MNIIVTGSLGHISRPLTTALVAKGHAVTVISSNPAKKQEIESLGARAAIGTLEDVAFLTSTFRGADVVYGMIPPPHFTDPAIDLMAAWLKIGDNYVQAIRESGVKRLIQLSSIGAHLAADSGIIVAHHRVEQALGAIGDVHITFMRPTGFYYNLLAFIPVIRQAGMIVSNYGADNLIPWVAPADIAAAIAEETEMEPVHRKVRYVASEEITCNDTASILGAAIGRPDLKWIVAADEQVLSSLLAAGLHHAFAAGLVEMNSSMRRGVLLEDYFRNRPAVMGNIKMTDFAHDFAAAYHAA